MIIKKAQQRICFLCQELMIQFYIAVIESALCTSITDWFGLATTEQEQTTTDSQTDRISPHHSRLVHPQSEKTGRDPSRSGHNLFQLQYIIDHCSQNYV